MARNIAPQDVSWFLDLNSRERLDLNPPYQRRSVWTPKDRRFFLDTVFSGYPCPPVFLYKSLSDDGKATYHVVDGKQRLETILRFVDNKIALPAEFADERLAGKKWRHLDVDQKKRFWNYQFAVEMLDIVDPATVKEIFDRYNRTSKNLERQELRHAKFDGWFAKYAEEEADKDEWRRLGIVTTALARRMRDVQFISELMLAVIQGDINGFDQEMLDKAYADYDIPADSDPTFSEQDFIDRFEAAKAWIIGLEGVDGVVTDLCKSYTNFYTLWAVAVLRANQLLPLPVASQRLREFMERVGTVVRSDDPEEFLAGERAEEFRGPYTYAQNARGASTELPQRRQRFEVLSPVVATL